MKRRAGDIMWTERKGENDHNAKSRGTKRSKGDSGGAEEGRASAKARGERECEAECKTKGQTRMPTRPDRGLAINPRDLEHDLSRTPSAVRAREAEEPGSWEK